MADGVFGVEIVTPEQSLYAGGATSIVLATSEGNLTVLDGHTPLVGDVVHCEVKVEQPEGTLLRLAVHGGFLQVDTSPGAAEGLAEGDGPLAGLSTRVTVLAGVAELATEIDVPRAEQARERAAQRVSDLGSSRGPVSEDVAEDLELAEAEEALVRADLRLAVAADNAA
ncbi:MAG TPA: ATP synthase delta/epsilon chain alpha-helix domain-containing protein [Acidimicrobiales bacterium]|nr:ATP synthase delta/epsilon chain alpha-helix domain-containing protein [Acidimicrobiales bacterium]